MPTECSNIRRNGVALVAATGLALSMIGCSAESAETNYPDDTQFGPVDTEISDVEVLDGTEDGLDLDNGNVPGSPNDDDLDPVDEDLGLNTDSDQPLDSGEPTD